MEHNEESMINVVSDSSKEIEPLDHGTSSMSSQQEAKDIVNKISHRYETVSNSHLFPDPDCKKCYFAARNQYYSIDDINNKMPSLVDSSKNNLNSKTKDENNYFTSHKDCQRCLYTEKMKDFTKIGKEYGESLGSSVKDAGQDFSNKIDESKISKKRKFATNSKPKCPACNENFEMYHFARKTPMMSMACNHTICKECVDLYIEKNRINLNRKNISVCDCPILDCQEKTAFRKNAQNVNLEFIAMYHQFES